MGGVRDQWPGLGSRYLHMPGLACAMHRPACAPACSAARTLPADRAEAHLLLEIYLPLTEMVKENRAFIAKAVTWAASEGIGQFLDLGTGLPAPPPFTRPRRRTCPEPG